MKERQSWHQKQSGLSRDRVLAWVLTVVSGWTGRRVPKLYMRVCVV